MSVNHLLVGMSDIHGGSSVAICPPEGMELDDGGRYEPSPAQVWVWEHYMGALAEVKALKKALKPASVTVAVNGDCVDGFHHPKSNAQFISALESHHVRIAHRVLVECFHALKPDAIHFTRGTGSHTGKASTLEEGLARVMKNDYPVVQDPDTKQWTSYARRYDIGGLRIDQTHHGRVGQRAHTRGPYLRLYAQDIELEHRLDGERPPDIALRSHYHIYGDSGRDHRWRTRVIALPALQLATEFTHRIAATRLADIGIVAIVIRDGREEVIPMLAKPTRPSVVAA